VQAIRPTKARRNLAFSEGNATPIAGAVADLLESAE
jgi:hypothetical protein